MGSARDFFTADTVIKRSVVMRVKCDHQLCDHMCYHPTFKILKFPLVEVTRTPFVIFCQGRIYSPAAHWSEAIFTVHGGAG